jgi:hypothetical protein
MFDSFISTLLIPITRVIELEFYYNSFSKTIILFAVIITIIILSYIVKNYFIK